MSKRNLTRRQNWRIKKIQQERVERAQKKDDRFSAELTAGELGDEQEGIIVAHYGRQTDVEGISGDYKGKIIRCYLRANLEPLVTGDRVIWRPGNSDGVVVANLPRASVLKRPTPHGELKSVAANIDLIVITFAPEPTPYANLIDRYLVAAELSNIRAVLLLNKTDLVNDSNSESLERLKHRYTSIGYKVLEASTRSSEGLAELQQELDQQISVFVGQSGVGKSSLINALLPGVDLRVGALSEASRKGTHTTTTARLFHFPSGGDLIDSPGIREFALWHLTPDELLEGFREFRPFLGHCRFRDCRHDREPGCALRQALENGDINPSRMQSYQQILQSLDSEAQLRLETE
ncbi:small ribosomal subunit biogenesis GTPase RsgA [Pokkaliibacter sp. CJK22405]|uniref:small ribosomal subunit biogenesis GTPase RsgA n=1 Tax=Pokkaliibacter sp. CJK22405 TaxID=3384615 RepID=UPI003984E68D